jgi:N-acetylglucosamine kinase-like BadF-type ATPase
MARNAEISVGVDLGGSWLRVRAITREGRPVFAAKRPAPLTKNFAPLLKSILKKSRCPFPGVLTVASRGVWTPVERRRLGAALRGLAKKIFVLSDIEAAWHAAFQKEGVVVVAGTGSIALGRDGRGRQKREGGLGPFLGDEGSAFWIGRAWLRTQADKGRALSILRQLRGNPQPVRWIAQHTHAAVRRAAHGDRLARAILAEAQSHLAHLVLRLSNQLRFSGDIPVSWGGQLLSEAAFRKPWAAALTALGRKHGKRFRFIPPSIDAATAAARFGWNHG